MNELFADTVVISHHEKLFTGSSKKNHYGIEKAWWISDLYKN